MLPYHWPHPSWRSPDPPGLWPRNEKFFARQVEKPCCPEQNELIANLQKRVEQLDSQLKAIWNYFAENSLSDAGSLKKEVSPSPAPLVAANLNRKRKLEIKRKAAVESTSIKRKKFIKDLEQKVAEERADNERMEHRISEMKKHLAELRSRRQQIEQRKLGKELNSKEDTGADVESADEDESGNDEGNNNSERGKDDQEKESVGVGNTF